MPRKRGRPPLKNRADVKIPIPFSVSRALKERLDTECARLKTTRSHLLRLIVEAYFEEQP